MIIRGILDSGVKKKSIKDLCPKTIITTIIVEVRPRSKGLCLLRLKAKLSNVLLRIPKNKRNNPLLIFSLGTT